MTISTNTLAITSAFGGGGDRAASVLPKEERAVKKYCG